MYSIRCLTRSRTECYNLRKWIADHDIVQTPTFKSVVKHLSTSRAVKMRLVQYTAIGSKDQKIGELKDGQVLELNKADASLPTTLLEVLRNGLLEKCKIAASKASGIPLPQVKLLSPVTGGDKVVAIGLNYRGHCEEQNLAIPKEPMFFSKFPSCIVGPSDAVKLREHLTEQVDWEVELALVIGKEATDVPRERAFDYIAGYCVAQDISARDWQKQRNNGQYLIGKSMGTFLPLGPALVTSDEVSDPHNLPIKCSINGTLKQNGNTNELIYRIDDIINRLSSYFTLLPGDVILTGTPAGVGCHRKPPEFLRPGDSIHSVIEGIGEITNPVMSFKKA